MTGNGIQPQRRVLFRRMNSSPCLATRLPLESNRCVNNNTPYNSNIEKEDVTVARARPEPLKISRSTTLVCPMKSCMSSSSQIHENKNFSEKEEADADDSTTLSSHSPQVESQRSMKRGVSFGHIQIREHPRALGDHPSVSSGPPLALGFYNHDSASCPDSRTTEWLPLDWYEGQRQSLRRHRRQLIIPRHERQNVLMEQAGVTLTEMQLVEREIAAVQQNRKASSEESPPPPLVQFFQNLGKVLLAPFQAFEQHQSNEKELNQLMIQTAAAVEQHHSLCLQRLQQKQHRLGSHLCHSVSEPCILPSHATQNKVPTTISISAHHDSFLESHHADEEQEQPLEF